MAKKVNTGNDPAVDLRANTATVDLARDVVSEVIETVCKSLLPAILSAVAEPGLIGGIGATCGTKFNCGTFSCTKDVACATSKFICHEFCVTELAAASTRGERV